MDAADVLTIDNLSSTDVKNVVVNLAAPVGGGDAQMDTVAVSSTVAGDAVSLTLQAEGLVISGLAARVVVASSETVDIVSLSGLAGNDVIDVSALGNASSKLVLDGGAGTDRLLGGGNDDVLDGGLDAVDDTFVFRAGLDDDTVTRFGNGTGKLDVSALNLTDSINDLSIVQDGAGNALIQLDRNDNNLADTGDSITLIGVTAAQVDSSDFVFIA